MMKTAWLGSMVFHLALAGGLLWVATDRPPVEEIGPVNAVTVSLLDAPARTSEASASASITPSVESLRPKSRQTVATGHGLPPTQPARAEIMIEPTSSEPIEALSDLSSTPAAVSTVEAIGAAAVSGADAGSTMSPPTGGASVAAADPWPAYFTSVRTVVERATHYPFSARLAGLEGLVTIAFLITADGAAEQIRVTEPSRYPVLNDAALETIRRVTRFPAPPLRDGRATVRVTVPLSFTLHHHEEAQPH